MRETEPVNGNLTDNQRLFCLYYVKYRNKVKAYGKRTNAVMKMRAEMQVH